MRTIENRKEYCECCGVDFTHKYYAQKISHQNKTNDNSVDIHLLRFKEAKTKAEKLSEVFDMIDLEDDNRHSFETIMLNYHCLIKKFRYGFDNREGKHTRSEELAKFLEKSYYDIRKRYNDNIMDKVKEHEKQISYLKEGLLI